MSQRWVAKGLGCAGLVLLAASVTFGAAQAPGMASSLSDATAAVAPADAAIATPALPINPKLESKYTKLAAKARGQNGSKQSESLAKLAEMDVQLAEDGFAVHRPTAAVPHLRAAAELADRAMVSLRDESTRGKTNGIKKVEISFQKITFALKGLAQQVSFRQRAVVKSVGTHFGNLRGQLLDMLFAPKKK